MQKRARKAEFDQKTRKIIKERDDDQCIFCQMRYHMKKAKPADLQIKSIMHFIPRSKGGLGIPENGAVGCQYHHDMLDNGNGGYREEMLELFEEYLQSVCDDWDKAKLKYDKWAFLKVQEKS